MKTAYRDIMERVRVDEEMRQRIQTRIQETDWESPPMVRHNPLRAYWAIAACFAVILLSTVLLPRQTHTQPIDPPPPVTAGPNRTEAGSAEELSDLVGFPVNDVQGLPFEPLETSYVAYGGALAEIRYTDGAEEITFRKSAGDGDNSGDYTAYERAEELPVGEYAVTLKGASGLYQLAVWSDGVYTYSIRCLTGMPKPNWFALLSGVNELGGAG